MPRSGSYGKALAEQHMPGNVHSMQLEHVLRHFQTDRGSSTPSGNRRPQIGRDRRDRAGIRGGGITRNPAMIVAAKPRCDPVVRVRFRRYPADANPSRNGSAGWFSREISPDYFKRAAPVTHLFTGSMMSIGVMSAFLLNLIFRIGRGVPLSSNSRIRRQRLPRSTGFCEPAAGRSRSRRI